MANLVFMIVLWAIALPPTGCLEPSNKLSQQRENFNGNHLRIVPTQVMYPLPSHISLQLIQPRVGNNCFQLNVAYLLDEH